MRKYLFGLVVAIILFIGIIAVIYIADGKKNGLAYPSTATSTQEVATSTTPAPIISTTYIDPVKKFSIEYPQQYALSTSTSGLTITIPREVQPDTNFSEAKVAVTVGTTAAAVKSCFSGEGGNTIGTSTKANINGATFDKFTYADAGAGNFYDTTSYRVVKNKQCFTVEYTIHSTNIGNYSPDQGIVPFNEDMIRSTLETIVQSFTFL